jgi:hypothetical protein
LNIKITRVQKEVGMGGSFSIWRRELLKHVGADVLASYNGRRRSEALEIGNVLSILSLI